jgi:competence ComEA-like helix-hairpin-helix protein
MYARVDRGRVFRPLDSPDRHIEPEPVSDELNINTATLAELTAINGVGKGKAKNIIRHRDNRPFTSLQDCAERVAGVSLAQLESAKAVV